MRVIGQTGARVAIERHWWGGTIVYRDRPLFRHPESMDWYAQTDR
jgi:hypothetical protein